MSAYNDSDSDSARLNTLRRYDSLQAGLDLIDQGFTLIDESLRMIAWNRTFLELLDFPEKLIFVGAPFESFIRYNAERGEYGPGDPVQQILERVDAARAFEPHTIERVRPNGTVLKIYGVPVPGHGFVTIYSDVTEQHRYEQMIEDQKASLEKGVWSRTAELSAINERLQQTVAEKEQIAHSLQRSEARMRLITDSIPALVAYFDAQRNYHYVNRGYQEWFGLDPTRPETVSAREFLGVQTYTEIRPNVRRALAGEPVTFEYEARTIDGRTRVLRTSLIPDLTAQKEVAGCFELTFDITDERRSAELLARAQKMEAVGQLSGGLAHDFNNILTVILGNLTALAEQAAVQPLVQEYLLPAMEATRRGSDLIKGLMTFSRKQPIEPVVVDINAQLEAVDRLVRRSLPETLDFVTDTDSKLKHARVNANQLQNAIINLILNARDATNGHGQVRLECQYQVLQAAEATRWHLNEGEYVLIRVRDNGAGMDEATRARIFEPFFTTKPAGQGSGLGLAMVYGFVHQSGGAIDVESAQGQGCEFRILLPLVETSLDTVDALGRNADATTGGEGLALLVEDDPAVRQMVRRSLLELGYSVVEAENGVEALTFLEQIPDIRLLLSDVVMPGGVDGRCVAQRALERGDIGKVLLMSGYAPESNIPLPVPLLAKPFTKADLAQALGRLAVA